jgi:SAM-dependent methyltransferase
VESESVGQRPGTDERANPNGEIWINLGCGHNSSPAWDNFDRSPMILLRRYSWLRKGFRKAGILADDHLQSYPENVNRRDLARPLPYADLTVSAVYSSHMLEHLYLDDARKLLRECFRVTKPGAILRLALPDGELFAKELVAAGENDDGEASLHYHEMLRAYPDTRPSGRRMITFIGGSNWHKWQPTRSLVRRLLSDAGFTNITEVAYREGELPQLDLVEVREDSMFFEAVR